MAAARVDEPCAMHEDTLLRAALLVEVFGLEDSDVNGRQGRVLETTVQDAFLFIEFSDGYTFEANVENLVTAEATTAKLNAAGAFINEALDCDDSFRKKNVVWIAKLSDFTTWPNRPSPPPKFGFDFGFSIMPSTLRCQESFRCAMDIACFAMLSSSYIHCFFPFVLSIGEY